MTDRIPYTKPSITELEVGYATDAARTGWGAKCYDYIKRFEAAWAEHLGVRHAVATSSCTGALHMGLAASGVGRGDEVIVPDTTWMATAAAVTYLGATPVFVDVSPGTWCIDPDAVEAAITARTRAIIAVHLYGNVCDMDRLLAIGQAHGLPIVEDAAEAIGSAWRGRRAGSIGTFGAFSFHGTKTMTTGEGGAFVTDDEELHHKVLTLSNHGRAPGTTRQFWADVVGFKYKMSNIQAAIGCGQIERIDELIAGKRRIFHRYRDALAGLPLQLNPEPAGTTNGYWMPTAVFDRHTGVTREQLQGAFEAANIDARVFFHPLSSMPMFEACPHNTVAWDLPTRAVNLPSYHDMTAEEQSRVAEVLRGVLAAREVAA